MSAVIGYARTSTGDQVYGLDEQLETLKASGCDKIFSEHASSVQDRPELTKALAYVREGDTFIVTRPDRLARSVIDMLGMIKELGEKGVQVKILSMNLDTGTPTGKLVLTILAGVAEWEREIMLERQRAGIRRAKEDGKYRGAWRFKVWKVGEEIDAMLARGMKIKEICEQLGVSRNSVWKHRTKRIVNPHITDQRGASSSPQRAAKAAQKKT